MPVTFGPSKSHPSYWIWFAQNGQLGDPGLGGYLICHGDGGVAWIVAPESSEVGRSWFSRDDAVTTAESNAACGDWFVPTCVQLKDPGYCCKIHWDSYSPTSYWSSTEYDKYSTYTWNVNFNNGAIYNSAKTYTFCVRAFRCVCY